jgi:hypothetical protein
MKVRVVEFIDMLGAEVTSTHASIQAAAKELVCNPRRLSEQLKGKRKETETIAGKVTHIEAYDGKTDNTTSTVSKHTNHAQENPPVGTVAPCRGWARLEQAMVKITFAIKWFSRKFQ